MPEVAREGVHAGDEFRRDRGVVIGQVAPDQFGDQRGLGGGKQLPADFGREAHIILRAAWVRTIARTAAAAASGAPSISASVAAIDAIV